MKITRRQLRKIIREFDDSRVWARQDDAAEEEWHAGYEAGLKGWEKAGNTLEYNDGYLQGLKDAKKELAISESILLEGNHAVEYAIGYEDARDGLPQNSDDPWYNAGYADFLEGIHDQYEALRQDGITNPPSSPGPMEGRKLRFRKIVREFVHSPNNPKKSRADYKIKEGLYYSGLEGGRFNGEDYGYPLMSASARWNFKDIARAMKELEEQGLGHHNKRGYGSWHSYPIENLPDNWSHTRQSFHSLREAMGSDADALKQIKNREKMIGRGMDMGTMPYNPDWDYDKKPKDTYKPKSGFGNMKMIKPFFDEYGFDFKSKTSHDGRASLPIGKGGPDNAYVVQIEFDGSVYKMKWIKRERIKKPKRGGPYMNVSDWSQTWEVNPTEKDIKTAVDEIVYEIGQDEAKGFE